MNEQTDMHNPDADKKTIGKGRKKNLICIFDDGKGMSNHYHSLFLFQQIGNGLLYCQLVLDVKGRGCFIQKQDRAVFQDSAGY